MKPPAEVTAMVIDYGTFLSVAEKLSASFGKVYYHSPFEKEYQDVRDCLIGTGIPGVERCDDIYSKLDEVDLYVFPDISFGGLQRYLKSLGKPVWGHAGATDLELDRRKFYETVAAVGLPVVPYVCLRGLSALAQHLRTVKDKWIKISRFRGNQETFKWKDQQSSGSVLDALKIIFGGAAERVEFIVQDNIESDMELGYDGWSIDGAFPSASFQGYEKKNELYLGSVLKAVDLPEEIELVNRKFAPVLASYGYRGWWATEVRVAKGVPYFIDPTPRMPGQTGEHQLESIRNFAEIIWRGANGFLDDPDFAYRFAAEATLHYKDDIKDPTIDNRWKVLEVPDNVRKWVKLYSYLCAGGKYHFPGRNTDEVGVAIGCGSSIDGAIKHLAKTLESLKEQPVEAEVGGFASLLESIHEAEKAGIPFGGKVPQPASIIEKVGKLL